MFSDLVSPEELYRKTSLDGNAKGYMYDLIVYDGEEQMKCLLHPKQNSLVEQEYLLDNSVVKVEIFS